VAEALLAANADTNAADQVSTEYAAGYFLDNLSECVIFHSQS